MTHETQRRHVERQLRLISLALYEGIAAGLATALSSGQHLSSPDYGWLLSMNSRAHMRLHWERSLPPTGWTVSGNPRLMGQTTLVSPDGSVTLHLLKENTVHPGGVPSPGPNQARRDLWAQPAFQDQLPGIRWPLVERAAPVETLCLLLWDYRFDEAGPVVMARVVHTIGAASYGTRVPIDMSYVISTGGTMYDQLRFKGASEIDDLFPTINERDNESGGSSQ